MARNKHETQQEFLAEAGEVAFAAAEAMSRGDLKTWQKLQNEAARLRKKAEKMSRSPVHNQAQRGPTHRPKRK